MSVDNIKQSIKQLAGKPHPVKVLPDRTMPISLPAKVGTGKLKLSGSSPAGGGAGIAPSEEITVQSTDGLFVFTVRVLIASSL
jgi:hypothetical protein